MNQETVYHKLVMRFHEYHYDTEFYVLVADIIKRMRKEGRGPLDSAQQLHKALVNTLRDRRGFEE